jgi:hypothetical protein
MSLGDRNRQILTTSETARIARERARDLLRPSTTPQWYLGEGASRDPAGNTQHLPIISTGSVGIGDRLANNGRSLDALPHVRAGNPPRVEQENRTKVLVCMSVLQFDYTQVLLGFSPASSQIVAQGIAELNAEQALLAQNVLAWCNGAVVEDASGLFRQNPFNHGIVIPGVSDLSSLRAEMASGNFTAVGYAGLFEAIDRQTSVFKVAFNSYEVNASLALRDIVDGRIEADPQESHFNPYNQIALFTLKSIDEDLDPLGLVIFGAFENQFSSVFSKFAQPPLKRLLQSIRAEKKIVIVCGVEDSGVNFRTRNFWQVSGYPEDYPEILELDLTTAPRSTLKLVFDRSLKMVGIDAKLGGIVRIGHNSPNRATALNYSLVKSHPLFEGFGPTIHAKKVLDVIPPIESLPWHSLYKRGYFTATQWLDLEGCRNPHEVIAVDSQGRPTIVEFEVDSAPYPTALVEQAMTPLVQY